MLTTTVNFSDVKNAVDKIKATENSFYVKSAGQFKKNKAILSDYHNYSKYGLSACGSRLGFPATFIVKHGDKHPETASKIISECYGDFLAKAKASTNNRTSKALFIRTFSNVIYGVLTDKYSIFDDDEVVSLIEASDYLMKAEEFWYDVSPEHFHARFVSPDTLDFDGDSSPLHFCVFIDNSMVGESSLRIRFGLYRSACTNGCIFGLKEFEIAKEVHRGQRDYVAILAEALSKCDEYEETLKQAVEQMAMTKSSIYELPDEVALSYLRDKLSVSDKVSRRIFEIYNTNYGDTQWSLCNAITEYAHEVENISERIRLERLAVNVA